MYGFFDYAAEEKSDMAELVRGGSAKTVGNLMTLLSLMKNQPLGLQQRQPRG